MKIRGEVFRKPKFNKQQKEKIKEEIKKDRFKNFWPVVRDKKFCSKTARILIQNRAVSFWKVDELGRDIKLVDIRDSENWLKEVCQMKFVNIEAVNE